MRKVVSLFTGAGTLDLGLEAAGFTTTVAVEYNAPACKTLRANRTDDRPWEVIERSIHEVPSREIMERGSIEVGEAALLVGGPPCQPFSKAAYWAQGDTKRLGDKRADTLSAYLRVLRDLQPQAFLLENVFGLTYKGKDACVASCVPLLRNGLVMAPAHVVMRRTLVSVLRMAGASWEEQLAVVREGLALDAVAGEARADLLVGASHILRAAGRPAEALVDLQEALGIAPSDAIRSAMADVRADLDAANS